MCYFLPDYKPIRHLPALLLNYQCTRMGKISLRKKKTVRTTHLGAFVLWHHIKKETMKKISLTTL